MGRSAVSRGFTLVEMLIVAPIVILAIGAFITAIVSLTGEALSSRGANSIVYDIQNALNQIEDDVKLSVGYLAINDKDVATTSSGVDNTTASFTNLGTTYGSNALILNSIVTINNPSAVNATALYLNNAPEACSNLTASTYSKNRPMTMNVVYYTKAEANGEISLWRRVIMQSNYANPSTYCGSTGPWQQPSCNPFNTSLTPPLSNHCKTSDTRLVTGVDPDQGFITEYFSSPSSTTPASGALDLNETTRKSALAGVSTVNVNLKVKRTIAGRDIVRSGTLRTTRLDTNASTIAYTPAPTSVPAAPSVQATVFEGNRVKVSWTATDTATSYSVTYRVRDAVTGSYTAWQPYAYRQSPRSTIFTAGHGDTLSVQVRAVNSLGQSAAGTANILIPIWAPLALKNGWTEYSSSWAAPTYTRTKAGVVMLRGMVKKATAAAAGEIIAELPESYWPENGGDLVFGTSAGGNVSARIDVHNGGNITYENGSNTQWISLDTIRYLGFEAGYTQTPLTLANGFTNYNNGYLPATYSQDSTGRVLIQGLLNGGTRTAGTTILTMPSNLRPALYQHHASRSFSSFHHMGLDSAGVLQAKGDGTGAYSINMAFLPSSVTGWNNITLANSWVQYDTLRSSPQYIKLNDNTVMLKGLIRSGVTTYETTIGTLPAGFRPKVRIVYTTANSGVYSRLDILPNGEIKFMGSSNTYYSLDNVIFMAEQ